MTQLQQHVSPGKLSAAHASLARNCAACHTSVSSSEDAKCVACHATNTAVLQRQPSAFHANIGSCAQCHIEHQGNDANLRKMDHATLASVGLTQLDELGDAALTFAIKQLKARGTTFVIMTHRASVLGVSDKMLVLRDGAMQMFGPRDDRRSTPAH